MTPVLRRAVDDEGGFTLVEMLVAMMISVGLGAIILTTLLTAQSSARGTQQLNDINEEARVALDRISRDIRQALPVTDTSGAAVPAITAVQNPDGAGWTANTVTSVTFDADFNGDGCIGGLATQACPTPPAGDANNPETVTYCWDPTTTEIYLVAGTVDAGTCTASSGAAAQPLLSGKVTAFELQYRSNRYLYDANGDGVTTWTEMDQAGSPVGNKNGVLDTPELLNVNAVVLTMTMSEGGHTQNYETQVDLRNVP